MIKVSITLPNSTQITLESSETEIISEVAGVLRDLPKALMKSLAAEKEDPDNQASSEKSNSVNEALAQAPEAAVPVHLEQTVVDATPASTEQEVTETAPAPTEQSGNAAASATTLQAVAERPPVSTAQAAAEVIPASTTQTIAEPVAASTEHAAPEAAPASTEQIVAEAASASTTQAVAEAASASTEQTVAEAAHERQDTPAGEAADAFIKFCDSAHPMGDMRRVVVATEGAQQFLGMDSVGVEELAILFDLAGWRRPHDFTQTLRNAARDKFRWLERVPGRAGRYAATDLGREITLGE